MIRIDGRYCGIIDGQGGKEYEDREIFLCNSGYIYLAFLFEGGMYSPNEQSFIPPQQLKNDTGILLIVVKRYR